MLELTQTWYLVLAALIFTIGAVGLLVNLSFVAFSRALDDVAGQAIVFFVLVVAAAEVVVGLGIIVAIMRRREGADADDISLMRG